MKLARILISLFFIISFMSCGGGGGGGSSSGGGTINCDSVPQISYSMHPTTIKNGQQVKEQISWCDADGDITTLYIKVKYGTVVVQDSNTASNFGITGTTGSKENTGTWSSGNAVGTFETSVWVVDAKGNSSNVVTFYVTVTAMTSQGKIENKLGSGSLIINRAINKIFH
jgi:hypothetical protein